jgi:hypothetical protein
MQIQTTIDISSQRISDLIVGAFEGGSTYWCQSVFNERGPEVQGTIYYANPSYFEGDFQMRVLFDDPDDEEGNGNGDKLIGPDELGKGLALFAAKYPVHFADFICENDDANTSDVFWQLVVLGEVVYG